MDREHDDPTRSFAWSNVPADRPRVLVFWDGGSTTRALEPGATLLVGRADDCDLQVLHPSVSRHHARVSAGPPLRIEDLGSSHGSRVDGAILSKGAMEIRPGQVVEVGGHAPDHPLHPAIAETRYLKSLFCRVVQD